MRRIGSLVDINGGVEPGLVFVHEVAYKDGIKPIETQLSVAASVDVDEIGGFTCAVLRRTIFLAGASVGRALAFPESCTFEFKLLDDP